MQTFLPYQSFSKSLQCLDDKRLGKQRVEAMQILNALGQGPTVPYTYGNTGGRTKKIILWGESSDGRSYVMNTPWYNHPAVRMWKDWQPLLEIYHDIAIKTWVDRGFNNSMILKAKMFNIKDPLTIPTWLTEEFCSAHRSNLLRKDPIHYGQFGWTESDDLPYIWPV